MKDVPLVKKEYLLKKFPGKGGWTYVEIPEIPMDKHAHFGWVRVRGFIDQHEIRQYHLMPMGNGQLFLPVKAAIRKKINKQAGDTIFVELYKDDSTVEIPQELNDCLEQEPTAKTAFLKLDQSDQKKMVDYIYAAKLEQTKVQRIVDTIEKLVHPKKK